MIEPLSKRPLQRTGKVVIATYVTLQLVIPLLYYIYPESRDERFRWRMFSSVRLRECQIKAYDVFAREADGLQHREVPLDSTLHRGWIDVLRHGQPYAVARFATWRCSLADAPLKHVIVESTCRNIDESRRQTHRVQTVCPRRYPFPDPSTP